MMKLASMYEIDVPEADVVVMMPHPGQAEMFCGGTILRWVAAGKRVAILDLTAGEAGSWGRNEVRLEEAARAGDDLGAVWRGCVRLPDGRVEDTVMSRMTITGEIKRLRATTVVAIDAAHPHPDAPASSRLVENSAFLAKLSRLDDYLPPVVVRDLWFASGNASVAPTVVVDITAVYEQKRAALERYSTLGPHVIDAMDVAAKHWGASIGARYGEPFRHRGPIPLEHL